MTVASTLALWALFADGQIRTAFWAGAVALVAVGVTWAQATLNRCWYERVGQHAVDRVTSAEWSLLVIGVLVLPFVLLGAVLAR